MRNKSKALIAGFLCLAAMALTACGAETTESPPSPEPSFSDKMLVIGKPQEVTATDPPLAYNATDVQLFSLVYEQLVGLDGDMQPVPSLATGWTPSEDGLSYHFDIRQGVKFHNGRQMTADDVVWSISRVMDPETASGGAAGIPTFRGIEKDGEWGVTISLSERFDGLPAMLASYFFSILPSQEIVAGEMDPKTTVLGTGPYKVTQHTQDQEWQLAAQADYWGGKPRSAGVTFKIMPDDAARVAALRTGEIHLSYFDVPNVDQVLQGVENVETFAQTTPDPFLMVVNRKHEPLDDIKVRQALSYALDRSGVQQLALSGQGLLTGAVPAPLSTWALPFEELPYSQYDLAKAKALLQEAGVQLPLKLKLYISSSHPLIAAVGLVVKEQLAEAGIECTVVDQELATFVDSYYFKGVHDLAVSWWGGGAEPSSLLKTIMYSTAALGGDDPKLLELVTKATSAAEGPERVELFKQIQLHVDEQAYIDFFATHTLTFAWRSDLLSGVSFLPTEGYNSLFRTIKDVLVK